MAEEAPMSVREFYDEIAAVYHLVYADWEASIQWQAEILDAVIRERLGAGRHRIFDVSCGIGTQTLGLAALGHEVAGADLSPGAVARASREATARGLEIDFSVADMRDCDGHPRAPFDIVLAADNAVPHLLTDEEILTAFEAFRRALRPGGLAVISVRDYAKEDRSITPQMRPFGVRSIPGGRCSVFQVWDFDGPRYDLAMYFVREISGRVPDVLISKSRYYAISIGALTELMHRAGFGDVERIDGRFFQPVLVARG